MFWVGGWVGWAPDPRIEQMDGWRGSTPEQQSHPKSKIHTTAILHTVLHPKAAQLLLQPLHRRPQPLHVAGARARPHPQQPLERVCWIVGRMVSQSGIRTMAGCMGTRQTLIYMDSLPSGSPNTRAAATGAGCSASNTTRRRGASTHDPRLLPRPLPPPAAAALPLLLVGIATAAAAAAACACTAAAARGLLIVACFDVSDDDDAGSELTRRGVRLLCWVWWRVYS